MVKDYIQSFRLWLPTPVVGLPQANAGDGLLWALSERRPAGRARPFAVGRPGS